MQRLWQEGVCGLSNSDQFMNENDNKDDIVHHTNNILNAPEAPNTLPGRVDFGTIKSCGQ